jgi:hypothetical protein
MALINCPSCGKDISEEAKRCPHCNRRIKKNKFILPVIIVILLLIVCVGVFYGTKQYQKIQAEKRQVQIESLLVQIDEFYAVLDFDSIQKNYDALEELHYDVSKQREILDYDRKVYPDAYAYYEAINDINDKLHNGDYNSLRELVNKMKNPTENFEALEINNDSEIGKYINNIRGNIMYSMFNSEYVNSTKYDLDYYLTSQGYAIILETYTEELVKEKFPYIESQK